MSHPAALAKVATEEQVPVMENKEKDADATKPAEAAGITAKTGLAPLVHRFLLMLGACILCQPAAPAAGSSHVCQ